MARPHNVRWTILAWLGGIVVLIALTIWGTTLFSKYQLDTYRAKLEARGEVFHVRQLAPPPAKTADNGADALVTACEDLIALVKKNNFKQYELGQLQTSPGEAEVLHSRPSTSQQKRDVPWEKFETEMSPLRPLLARIREAARAQILELQPDYSRGYTMPVPFATPMLGASQHLGRETLLFLREKRYDEAVENVQVTLRLSGVLAKQSSLISQLVSISIIQIAAVSTWEILNSDAPRNPIEKLSTAWTTIDSSAHLAASLRMERAWGRDAFGSPISELATTATPLGGASMSHSTGPHSLEEFYNLGLWTVWAAIFRYSDERRYLENYQAILESIDSQSARKELLGHTNRVESSLSSFQLSRLFSVVVLPSVTGSIKRFASVDCLQKLVVTAAAIRLYQIDHEGNLPGSLESLVPTYLASTPLDPMDFQPLRYQNKGAQFLLYSIGADGVDNGGNASEPKGKHARQFLDRIDIVWPQPITPATSGTEPGTPPASPPSPP